MQNARSRKINCLFLPLDKRKLEVVPWLNKLELFKVQNPMQNSGRIWLTKVYLIWINFLKIKLFE